MKDGGRKKERKEGEEGRKEGRKELKKKGNAQANKPFSEQRIKNKEAGRRKGKK